MLRRFAPIVAALATSLAVVSASATAGTLDDLCPVAGVPYHDYDALARLVDDVILPIPDGHPGPLVPPSGGWAQFGRAQPRTPAWNPPGPKRVGIQAGHYRFDEAPDEQSSLRWNPGAPGGGRVEWQVTLEIAERAAEMLRADSIEVDVLPTTIPVRYRAHAFVSVHVDGDASGTLRGYKVARPNFSSIPEVDDAFAAIAHEEYGRATGLPDDTDHVSGRMRNYYAFNARRYQHAVAPGVPQLIIETGFMSNAADRRLLFNRPDIPALGIRNAILAFLSADLR